MLPIGTVVPYVRNPRKNTAAIAKVAVSLREFGWRQPIVVDEAMTVVAGHTRLEAARSLGMAEVPVHVATGLTPQQVKAYRLADNRTGDEAEWDSAMLALEVLDLQGDGFDLALTGFDDTELDKLLRRTAKLDDTNAETLVVPDVPRTKVGDVIVLGVHRLVCGDSTAVINVERATQGQAVGALVFDPPFERTDLIAAMRLDEYGAPDVFVFGDCMNSTQRAVSLGLPWRFGFVWDGVTRWMVPGKPLLAHKTCDWFSLTGAYDHDAVKDPRKVETKPLKGTNARGAYVLEPDPRGKSLTSVFRSPVTAESHGAEHSKPVLWLAMILGNCSGGLVLDLFAGSGTSLIACEQVGRQWCGIELNPAYCDVIVARWERATGLTAVYDASATGIAA